MSGATPRLPRRRWHVVLAVVLAAVAVLALVPVVWLARLSSSAGDASAPVGIVLVVAVVSTVGVGAGVAGRRPRHPVGWLLLGLGVALVGSTLLELYVRQGLLVRPGSLPGARYLVGFVYSGTVVWLSCAGFVLLLTPTGALPSPRWRWWARVAAIAPAVTVLATAVQPDPMGPEHMGNPLAVPALAGVLLAAGVAGVAVVVAALFVAAGSLVWRFRRARGVERQQLRWLAGASVLASVLLLVALVAAFLGRDEVVAVCATLCVALLPLATGAAVQRYRLYDLDRIVSRTVAYGLLTVLLAGGYAAVVLGLGQALDSDSPLLVAAATLAVAGVFQPARRRIQHGVDRRFNRRRYDGTQAVAEFSARLRQEIDLDTLTAALVALIDRTIQPTGVSLSLLPPAAGSSTDGWRRAPDRGFSWGGSGS